MSLSACTDSEFTCNDGSCIDMDKKCDGREDCSDGDEENNCEKIITFAGYNRHIVPAPLEGDSTLIMNIGFTIAEIVNIDEKNGFFKVVTAFVRQWYNPQLKYRNLKRNASLNRMTPADRKTMWIPWTTFDNVEYIDSFQETDVPDILDVVPNADFKHTKGDKTNQQNTWTFEGSENKISYERKVSINCFCDFDMKWYPFDIQLCDIQLFHQERSISMRPMTVKYKGARRLAQHTVLSVNICSATVKDRPGVLVEVVLGRPLFGSILTAYLPTVVLIILSQLLGRFHRRFMDIVIAENITLLLVLSFL